MTNNGKDRAPLAVDGKTRRLPGVARRMSGFCSGPALILLLLFAGCVRVPDAVTPPSPVDGTISSMSRQYDADFRESCLKAAAKLRKNADGKREWNTDRDYLEGHRALRKIAVEHSGQVFADRQQLEATPFEPDRMANWLELVAREGVSQ
jgi:hypothetical protein